MANALDHRLRETQYGFRKNRSCTQPLFILHRLHELALDRTGAFYMLFLDWEKTFDKITHRGLHSALVHLGVDPKYVKVIDALYRNPQFRVSSNGKDSDLRTASTGIRQGCPLSPYLFLFVHSVIMNEVDVELHEQLGHLPWVHSSDHPLSQLAYADDTMVVARSAALTERRLQTIQSKAFQFNIKLNLKKCELIRLNSQNNVCFLTPPGHPPQSVKVVHHAKYLGMVISQDGSPMRNIRERAGQARAAVSSLAKCWLHSTLPLT